MTPTQKLIEAAEAAVEALRYYETESFDGYANPNGGAAADALAALRTALEGLREAQAEPVARIDPAQDPMRPAYFMNYAADETPAEQVLRKLACWLGVGGYNAPKVDAEVFHRKIVDGVEMLLKSATPPTTDAPAQANCADDLAAWVQQNEDRLHAKAMAAYSTAPTQEGAPK